MTVTSNKWQMRKKFSERRKKRDWNQSGVACSPVVHHWKRYRKCRPEVMYCLNKEVGGAAASRPHQSFQTEIDITLYTKRLDMSKYNHANLFPMRCTYEHLANFIKGPPTPETILLEEKAIHRKTYNFIKLDICVRK